MWGLVIILLWFCLIVLVNYANEINDTSFLYICNINFYFIYKINLFKNVYLSLRIILILISISSCIMWYVFITNNYFLKIEPTSSFTVVFVMFLYLYILLYIFLEFSEF